MRWIVCSDKVARLVKFRVASDRPLTIRSGRSGRKGYLKAVIHYTVYRDGAHVVAVPGGWMFDLFLRRGQPSAVILCLAVRP